jgi:hypothetical protein
MWRFYRKTFIGMQAVIFLIALLVYFLSGRELPQTIACLVVMELGAVSGARWGWRLSSMSRRDSAALPLESRI